MEILDVIIIYLALGAPFAVYRFQTSSKETPRAAADAAISGAFWLIILPAFLHTKVTEKLRSRKNLERVRFLRSVASDLARSLNGSPDAAGIFEIREIVESYSGLSELINDRSAGTSPNTASIFTVSGHPDGELASALVARRHLREIRRHRTAHAERLIRMFAASGAARSEGSDALKRLFADADDIESIKALDSITALEPDEIASGRPKEKTRWETREPKLTGERPANSILADLTMMSRLPNED